MIRNTFLATFCMLALAAVSQAAVTVTSTSEATPGLAGYKTFQLTATSDADPIVAVDFIGTGSQDPATGFGFFGAMNQLNPAALGTVFMDNNGVITALGGNPAQDSQFKVLASTVTVPDPANNTREGANILQAIWAWGAPQGQSIPLAQLVIPDAQAGKVDFRGIVSVQAAGGPTGVNVAGCVGTCGGGLIAPLVADLPQFNTTTLGEVVNLQPVDTAPGSPPVAWSGLFGTYTPGHGALPGAPGLGTATWSINPTTGAFQFNTLGATRGLYTFNGTASGPGGSDGFAIAVDVTQVPEPASLALFGLALVGFVGFARKRS